MKEAFAEIITQNEQMLAIFQNLEAIAQTSQPVLITGDTGTGKELFAKAIHALSGFPGRLVTVNVAGLDDILFSDTLFGHVKGAFTGADRERKGLIERASSGTLFLDEIGDLSMSSQVKLLRLVEQREFMQVGSDESKRSTARVITATNRDLWEQQRSGTFRKDLNFRLRTHHVHIPPLADRLDDIPLLVDHFLTVSAEALGKKKPTAPKELYGLLKNYSFPGNVRELQTICFDAVSKHKAKVLSLDVFKEYIFREKERLSSFGQQAPEDDSPVMFSRELPTIRDTTNYLVLEAMKRTSGNKSNAALILGISRQALSKRLKSPEMKRLLKDHLDQIQSS